MKKFFYLFLLVACVLLVGNAVSSTEKTLSCGPGYVLVSHKDVDGIQAVECQKLWCRDLENGKSMGASNGAASGYKTTSYPIELCDAENNCIECFGDRKWCSGEPVGIWNPEYGAYTRGGTDNANYISYQKGSCFAWRLEKPECEDGETAILQDGEWVCAVAVGTETSIRETSVRRTGTLRRPIR